VRCCAFRWRCLRGQCTDAVHCAGSRRVISTARAKSRRLCYGRTRRASAAKARRRNRVLLPATRCQPPDIVQPLSGCQMRRDVMPIVATPGAQFTKYLTIYRKFIVRSTYDSDLKVLKFLLGISWANLRTLFQTILQRCKWIAKEKKLAPFVGCFVN